MSPKRAEEIAIMALGWIASDEELAGGLLGASGAAAEDLRLRAREPEFLGFVLDFLLGDDRATEAFIIASGLKPSDPLEARQHLPGGDAPNWT